MESVQTNTLWNRRVMPLAVGILLVGALLVAPHFLALVNALALGMWTILQLHTVRRSSSAVSSDHILESSSDPLFLSVHVATHNEPPEVVCSTLDALAQVQYSAFEVIVIDNNTTDRALWEPVREHCRSLGSNFTFLHKMGVAGAKAGALNIARKVADSRTKFIVTVDADYLVTEDFLSKACAAIHQTVSEYIQFPQAYQSLHTSQQPLINELGDYFERHAQSSLTDRSMLLTGTLSVISVDALNSVGGWPTSSITEDAELGLMLQRKGYVGLFVNHRVGEGMLPPSAFELRKQRHRWTSGNIQVLLQAMVSAPRSLRLSHVSQLSAWCSFLAVPYALLILLPALSLVLPGAASQWAPAMEVVLVSVLAQILIFMALSRTRPGCFSVKWALALTSSLATISALVCVHQRFRCTRRVAGDEKQTRVYLLVCYLPLFVALVNSAVQGWWSAVAACLLMLSSAWCYSVLDAQLTITQNSTPYRPANRRASHAV